MRDRTNDDRVKAGKEVLRAYLAARSGDPQDEATTLIDIVVDLCHYAVRHAATSYSPADILRIALDHFGAEVGGEA